MQKIFSSEQVRKADAYTIQNEPIPSTDLMERAAIACVEWLNNFRDLHEKSILILCGPGNNGGDGIAMARLLHKQGKKVIAFVPGENEKISDDLAVNLKRATDCGVYVRSNETFTDNFLTENYLLIDALFGSGLSKPLVGKYKQMVERINTSPCITVSIDIPSGLFSDKAVDPKTDTVVKADHTLSFQFPKLSFLFPENELFAGNWQVLPIGIHTDFIQHEPCRHYLIEHEDVKGLLKPRARFSHKGTYGHALLIGGSKGKMGAVVLMGKACQRSGAGLVTAHIPGFGYTILQTAVPENMVSVDVDENECTRLPLLDNYAAVACGPGLDSSQRSAAMLKLLIQEISVPLLLDADALNILSENPTWLAFLPKGAILTPHPGEFARLAGKTNNSFERLETLKSFAIRYQVNIVLKGSFTVTCTPLGNCYFNPTGNPGMATGGSGDVLTGLITGLLAQGYNPTEACLTGVYLHGRAGDIAVEKNGYESLIAGDIIRNFGKAFVELY